MHVLDAAGASKPLPQPSLQLCCPVSSVPQWVSSSGVGSICLLAAHAVGGLMLQ